MKVAIYQMQVVAGEIEANLNKVSSWTERVMKEYAPDILAFPELWKTAYAYDILPDIADTENSKETKLFFSELAKKYRVNIIGGSVAVKQTDGISNTALAFDRNGNCIYKYDKVHLASSMNEQYHFIEGKQAPHTFTIEGVDVGYLICYDLRFPEISRPLAVEGAKILFYVAAWPLKRIDHWNSLLKARAIESQAFVVGCNRTGENDGFVLGGNCCVFDPYGHALAAGGEHGEDTIIATLDLKLVDEMRHTVAVFEDRRPETYIYK
ncbi:MAG: carbon-nitrogen family hydrolase [Candidatus Heteroscillospira sp.]|jgi:omega-amidase